MDATSSNARREVDARGRSCPMPIIELMRELKTMSAGEEVEVLADDRAFPADVAAWCKKTSNTLVSLAEKGGAHVAIVRKGS
jgi:TusA-related sulfurtransferase